MDPFKKLLICFICCILFQRSYGRKFHSYIPYHESTKSVDVSKFGEKKILNMYPESRLSDDRPQTEQLYNINADVSKFQQALPPSENKNSFSKSDSTDKTLEMKFGEHLIRVKSKKEPLSSASESGGHDSSFNPKYSHIIEIIRRGDNPEKLDKPVKNYNAAEEKQTLDLTKTANSEKVEDESGSDETGEEFGEAVVGMLEKIDELGESDEIQKKSNKTNEFSEIDEISQESVETDEAFSNDEETDEAFSNDEETDEAYTEYDENDEAFSEDEENEEENEEAFSEDEENEEENEEAFSEDEENEEAFGEDETDEENEEAFGEDETDEENEEAFGEDETIDEENEEAFSEDDTTEENEENFSEKENAEETEEDFSKKENTEETDEAYTEDEETDEAFSEEEKTEIDEVFSEDEKSEELDEAFSEDETDEVTDEEAFSEDETYEESFSEDEERPDESDETSEADEGISDEIGEEKFGETDKGNFFFETGEKNKEEIEVAAIGLDENNEIDPNVTENTKTFIMVNNSMENGINNELFIENETDLREEFEGSGETFSDINNRNTTKTGRILGMFSRQNDSFPICTTPKGEAGHCRRLGECLLSEALNNFNGFLQQLCLIRGALVGICCPDNPVIESVNPDENETSVLKSEEIKQPPEGCGLNIKTRIVGGTISVPNEWTWMVALMRRNRFYCGGVVINNWYILTAAHCVMGMNVKDLTVRLGEYDFKEESKHTEDLSVSEIKRHAQFITLTFEHDIALLKLKRSIKYSKFVGSICLPEKKGRDYSDVKGTVVGWGTVSFGGAASPVLRQVTVPVWKNADCDRTYLLERIGDAFMCAGSPEKGEDACQGDSGGPLMTVNENGRWEVIGLVSWGRRCGDPTYPGVYTRVTTYLDWIKQNAV